MFLGLKLTAILGALAVAAVLSTGAFAHDFSKGAIRIDHPWSRVTPSAAPVAGAYLTVTNLGTEADRLMGGSTPIAERIEIHQMSIDDGVARMRPLTEGVEIAAGATAELVPGGTHLMLIKPSRQLIEGERFTATLEFARAGAIEVEFVLQRNPEVQTGSEHGGHAP